mmetsp:Transcript_11511/g.48310  ORF Transcript_11511/g.48310 Transcript_11511/m.48310 type:complete len:358 (+) Transcript_11511:7129-8202(+)
MQELVVLFFRPLPPVHSRIQDVLVALAALRVRSCGDEARHARPHAVGRTFAAACAQSTRGAGVHSLQQLLIFLLGPDALLYDGRTHSHRNSSGAIRYSPCLPGSALLVTSWGVPTRAVFLLDGQGVCCYSGGHCLGLKRAWHSHVVDFVSLAPPVHALRVVAPRDVLRDQRPLAAHGVIRLREEQLVLLWRPPPRLFRSARAAELRLVAPEALNCIAAVVHTCSNLRPAAHHSNTFDSLEQLCVVFLAPLALAGALRIHLVHPIALALERAIPVPEVVVGACDPVPVDIVKSGDGCSMERCAGIDELFKRLFGRLQRAQYAIDGLGGAALRVPLLKLSVHGLCNCAAHLRLYRGAER